MMKKISLLLMAAVVMIGLSACNKEKSAPANEAPATEEAVVVVEEEVVEEIVPAKSPAELLKEFETYVKDYADAFNNLTKDPAKYSKLAAQSTQWAKDMAAVKDQLTDKEKKKYEKLLQSLKDINSPK